MKITAKSKINLYLRVCGKRADGYHEIETLFVPLENPSDELDIEFPNDETGTIRVSSDAGLPEDQNNLCGKAAMLSFQALGISPSIRIFIHKHIPVTGGMGGGSSDAAVVIRAIQDRFGRLPDGGVSVALACGADVPYFLNPVAAIGRGVGERVEEVGELSLPPIRIVPMNFPVSARWAYQHRKETDDTRSAAELLSALRRKDFEKAALFLRNDLALALWEKFPVLQMMREFLLSSGALGVQVTGSGPTLFAVFPDQKTCEACEIPLF